MADYNKIGLLILNEEKTKFLVCEPGNDYLEKSVTQFLMPGGQLEESNDLVCLEREIKEELDALVDVNSIKLINEYTDRAATPGKTVMIKLYEGNLLTEPKASSEIGALHWIGKEDENNEQVSPIIRNKIIPDLLEKQILQ